jgi:hypothetical protein
VPVAWLPQSRPRAVLGDQGSQSCRVVLASRFGQPAEQLLESPWCDHLQRVAVRSSRSRNVCQCRRSFNTMSWSTPS